MLDFALEYTHEYCSFLSSPLAVKRDIAVTILLRYILRACVCGCVRPSRFVQVITPTILHVFQNYLTQLFGP